MNELYEKSLHTLELARVLEMRADHCVSEEGKQIAAGIRPYDDADEVRRLLQETTDACHMVEQKGTPSLRDIKDVKASVSRADRGGSLNTKELLRVAGVLRTSRTVKAYGDGEEAGSLGGYFRTLTPNRYLEERITGAILSED